MDSVNEIDSVRFGCKTYRIARYPCGEGAQNVVERSVTNFGAQCSF